MEVYERKAKFTELKPYCHLSKPGDFMEVCEWKNGEGVDVCTSTKQFSLTWGELEALTVLAKYSE